MAKLLLFFKLADLTRYTGATAGQIEHWIREGALIPHKGARSSGDHRQFSLVNLIEVAQAQELTRVHLTVTHIKLLLAAQRKQLDAVPESCRAGCAWSNYVQQIQKGAELLGETSDPRYVRWMREVSRLMRQQTQKRDAPDTEILERLVITAAHPREMTGETAAAE